MAMPGNISISEQLTGTLDKLYQLHTNLDKAKKELEFQQNRVPTDLKAASVLADLDVFNGDQPQLNVYERDVAGKLSPLIARVAYLKGQIAEGEDQVAHLTAQMKERVREINQVVQQTFSDLSLAPRTEFEVDIDTGKVTHPQLADIETLQQERDEISSALQQMQGYDYYNSTRDLTVIKPKSLVTEVSQRLNRLYNEANKLAEKIRYSAVTELDHLHKEQEATLDAIRHLEACVGRESRLSQHGRQRARAMRFAPEPTEDKKS